MQVRARPTPSLLGAAAQQFRDQIVALREVPVSFLAPVRMAALGGVVAIIAGVGGRLLGARGVDLAGVEAPPLLRVREQIVGGGDLLEPLLGLLVARIEIRVQLLGQFSIGAANLVGRSRLGRRGFRKDLSYTHPSRARPISLSRDADRVSRRRAGAPSEGGAP